MDIFNKKKILKLQEEIKELEETLKEIRGLEEENTVLIDLIEEKTAIKNKIEREILLQNKKLKEIKSEIAKVNSVESLKEVKKKELSSTKRNSTMDKNIKKELDENNEEINKLIESYESRYTSKGNLAIFKFMVMALKERVKNIVNNINNVEEAKKEIKVITDECLEVAEAGNKQLLGSFKKFISEVEILFIKEIEIINK